MKSRLSKLDLPESVCLRTDSLVSRYEDELRLFIEELGLVPCSMISDRDVDIIASHLAEDDVCYQSWMDPEDIYGSKEYLMKLRMLSRYKRRHREESDNTLFFNR